MHAHANACACVYLSILVHVCVCSEGRQSWRFISIPMLTMSLRDWDQMTCHVQLGISFCEWKKVKLSHSATKTKYHVHLCNCANVQLCTYVLYTNLWDISIKSRRHSFIFSIRHYFDLKKLEKNYITPRKGNLTKLKMWDSLVLICIILVRLYRFHPFAVCV